MRYFFNFGNEIKISDDVLCSYVSEVLLPRMFQRYLDNVYGVDSKKICVIL